MSLSENRVLLSRFKRGAISVAVIVLSPMCVVMDGVWMKPNSRTGITTSSSNGFGEFVLTGTNVGSYGQGEGRNIAELMKKMSLIRGSSIRVGSLEPIQVNESFREILDEPWLERHLAHRHSAQQR
jgi:hypothetical protein